MPGEEGYPGGGEGRSDSQTAKERYYLDKVQKAAEAQHVNLTDKEREAAAKGLQMLDEATNIAATLEQLSEDVDE